MFYFKDRCEAGQGLAAQLMSYKRKPDVIVLGLPRGGVPVAYEIAKTLQVPLDVFMVRKLGVPGYEELAMGAIAEQDVCIFNDELMQQLDISLEQRQAVVEQEKLELKRRQQLYRANKALTLITNKTVILVDDGIATGATVKAAILALTALKVAGIILAIPVAAVESLIKLRPLVNEIVCLYTPEPFYSVGQWYANFPQTTDEEVKALLSSR